MVSGSGLRLDLHNHTFFSPDGLMSPAALLAAARARGLACLAITDHDTIRGGVEGARLAASDLTLPRVIPGVELSTQAGEVIGLYLSEEVPAHLALADAVARIREQGGLVYLPHPYDMLRRGTVSAGQRAHAAELADLIEVMNGRCLGPWFNTKAAQLARLLEKPGGAGSDAHRASEVGRAYLLVDSLPTRDTLTSLVAAGIVRLNYGAGGYLKNWGFQGLSPVTRLRRRITGPPA